MVISNIQNIITFFAVSLDDSSIPNVDEFISEYQQVKPIEDPIFWKNKQEAEKVLKEIDQSLSGKVVTKISLLKNYCPAEEYHQKYLEKR